MPYSEDDLLPLSALQHLLFCPRQCALIHIEQAWQENLFTAQGRLMHERVDQSGRESRKDVRIEYAMPLRCLRLGLIGKADVVEFHLEAGAGKRWLPFPVEYKRGKQKKENWDKVQLCAQAICLEEMLGLGVPAGALFYGKNRRRQDVLFSDELRRETEDAALQLHELIAAGRTPAPVYTKRCDSCSFYELCLPRLLEKKRKVESYLDQAYEK
ncbi:MAG: CRISPR-associated protein Cas4 [Proteobacteria bacterium]|nr:CRISPR-associated protein Cas4 [Pseudomonadota bacterium]MBU0964999.1 CRISPR-associated protein Cas4 [Pseudomonadota bacterium]